MPAEAPKSPSERAVDRRDVSFDIPIVEKREDQQLVFGWLYVSKDRLGNPVVDHSGETISIEELEKATYQYMLKSREAGEMHERVTGIGKVVTAVVFTPELKKAMGIPPGILPDGAFIGLKIEDEQAWEGVRSGKYKMFSLGGRAFRRALEE